MKKRSWSMSDLNTLCKYSNYNKLLFYMRSNMIRAPLEAAITLYLLVMTMFTTFFNTEPLPADKVFHMIFLPLILSTFVCIVYTFYITEKVNKWAFSIIEEAQRRRIDYEYINCSFKEVSFKIHRAAVICYFLFSLGIPLVLASPIYGTAIYLKNPALYIHIITILGTLFGVLWNIYGYYSEQRIDWKKIFPRYAKNDLRTNIKLRKSKYRAYKQCIKYQVFILILILVLFSVIILSLNDKYLVKEELVTLIDYSAIITLFISLFSIYLRQTYKIFFKLKRKNREDPSAIFPNIFELTVKK